VSSAREGHTREDGLESTDYTSSRQSCDDTNMEASVWVDRKSRDVWNSSPQPSPSSDHENHVWREHMKNHVEISQEAD